MTWRPMGWMGVSSAYLLTAAAFAQWLSPVGLLPGHVDSGASGVSADGSVVVGWSYDGANNVPFRWTLADGMQPAAMPAPGGQWAIPTGVSGDGSTIFGICDAGDGLHQAGYRWRASTGPELLQGLSGPYDAWPNGSSYDGGILVGQADLPGFWAVPAIWLGGTTCAAYPSNGHSGWVDGASGDGTVAAGTLETSFSPGGDLRVAVWTNGALQIVGTLPGTDHAIVGEISADGSTVVARATDPSGDDIAMIWRANEGLKPLPRLPDTRYAWPLGLSGDGRTVVGWYDDHATGQSKAFIYRKSLGMAPLLLYLTNLGVDVTGWELQGATGISADGTTIVGEGTYNGQHQAFVAYVGKDTDDDGLLDDWEINGIPYTDAHGASQRYLLDADQDGISDANPLRKDLFVEVDAMFGFQSLMDYLDPVVEAFDRAPVPAPDAQGGLPGIALHLQKSLTSDIHDFDDTWNDFFSMKQVRFGVTSEIQSQSRWEILAAKARAYRYCIFGRRFGTSADDRSRGGIAEGIGCNDFMVTLGAYNIFTANYSQDQIEDFSAGVFMHELGHALGLHHGGGDDANFKPNYFSTMNYNWCNPANEYSSPGPNGVFRRFFPNYSDTVMPALDESALIETAGVTASPPDPDLLFPWSVPLGATNCDALQACSTADHMHYCTRFTYFDAEVDWNNDCSLSSTPVSADINNILGTNPSPNERLEGFNDWANIQYDFKGTLYAADGPPATPPIPELTLPEYLQILDRAAPPPCLSVSLSPDQVLCPGGQASLTATPTGAGPFAFRWQALSPSGRLVANLQDGPFADPATGLSFHVQGATTASITIDNVTLGAHPPQLKFSVAASNACGRAFGPVAAITLSPCAPACDPDVNQDGNTDQDDVAYLINAVGGGSNPTNIDPDFNHDGNVDQDDIAALINVVAGGACP